jgi:hypothetical protein
MSHRVERREGLHAERSEGEAQPVRPRASETWASEASGWPYLRPSPECAYSTHCCFGVQRRLGSQHLQQLEPILEGDTYGEFPALTLIDRDESRPTFPKNQN